MEQQDYILREIEKIGILMRAIRNKFFGNKENLAITLEKQVRESKDMLLNEINFDLDKFLNLNIEDSKTYVSYFDGFNIGNIESLANVIAQMGYHKKSENSKIYLEKALQLYELCNSKDKIYSLERETNIDAIKNALKKHSTS